MKRLLSSVAFFFLAAAAVIAEDAVFFQHSLFSALADGVYDGTIAVAQLKEKGDFGLGTFDRLDGEMIMLDGIVYQAKADGTVAVAGDSMTSPFASVTAFRPGHTFTLSGRYPLASVREGIDREYPFFNYPCAIRVKGTFRMMRVRSVPAQQKPYRRLVEVTKQQPVFEYENVNGTIVGFRLPASMSGINVPGYHFHFLSDDKARGGHIIDFVMTSGTIRAARADIVTVSYPGIDAFAASALTSSEKEALRIEGGHQGVGARK